MESITTKRRDDLLNLSKIPTKKKRRRTSEKPSIPSIASNILLRISPSDTTPDSTLPSSSPTSIVELSTRTSLPSKLEKESNKPGLAYKKYIKDFGPSIERFQYALGIHPDPKYRPIVAHPSF